MDGFITQSQHYHSPSSGLILPDDFSNSSYLGESGEELLVWTGVRREYNQERRELFPVEEMDGTLRTVGLH